MSDNLKVAVYIRVSTGRQETENQGLDLIPFCERNGWEIHEVYEDVVSGADDKRPAFLRMFEDAHKLLFDIVLFWDLSRFSRSGTLFTLQKLTELDKLGIRWKSFNEPYLDSAGQFSEVVISVMATLAKIEREKISERTKAGLRRTVEQNGTKLGPPSIPDHIKAEIRRMRVEEGLSHSQIFKRMEDVTFKLGNRMRQGVGNSTIARICKDLPPPQRGVGKSEKIQQGFSETTPAPQTPVKEGDD